MRPIVFMLAVVALLSLAAIVYGGGRPEITGKWVKVGANPEECACGDCIDIPLEGKLVPFCVESNQIYLNVRYELDERQGKVYILFDSVLEVGTGGAALPWDKYDKQEPLAELDVNNVRSGRMSVRWFGFRRKDKHQEQYVFGSDYSGIYRRRAAK
ncbi:hypothetical protein [Geomonas subterranea]|uniref:DUF2147 domain-containing protein n=1 Tax=Geomonas subterranea TaxID=2847989 RepID=A0ABX8LDQ7_9BACT|nr:MULTISPECIES: hypothetical protein [Geomonas]QXE90185.1 hypothetical protein KP001_17450 [Geomonas subterranea]QXM07689.1 hypothetical protein KP002_11830 [Geomonas subterranea]